MPQKIIAVYFKSYDYKFKKAEFEKKYGQILQNETVASIKYLGARGTLFFEKPRYEAFLSTKKRLSMSINHLTNWSPVNEMPFYFFRGKSDPF